MYEWIIISKREANKILEFNDFPIMDAFHLSKTFRIEQHLYGKICFVEIISVEFKKPGQATGPVVGTGAEVKIKYHGKLFWKEGDELILFKRLVNFNLKKVCQISQKYADDIKLNKIPEFIKLIENPKEWSRGPLAPQFEEQSPILSTPRAQLLPLPSIGAPPSSIPEDPLPAAGQSPSEVVSLLTEAVSLLPEAVSHLPEAVSYPSKEGSLPSEGAVSLPTSEVVLLSVGEQNQRVLKEVQEFYEKFSKKEYVREEIEKEENSFAQLLRTFNEENPELSEGKNEEESRDLEAKTENQAKGQPVEEEIKAAAAQTQENNEDQSNNAENKSSKADSNHAVPPEPTGSEQAAPPEPSEPLVLLADSKEAIPGSDTTKLKEGEGAEQAEVSQQAREKEKGGEPVPAQATEEEKGNSSQPIHVKIEKPEEGKQEQLASEGKVEENRETREKLEKTHEEKVKSIKRMRKMNFFKSQKKGFALSLTNKLTIIWGPPGTGKTHLLGLIALRYIEVAHKCSNNMRILITANTNAAIDKLLDKIREFKWILETYWKCNFPEGQFPAWLARLELHRIDANTKRRINPGELSITGATCWKISSESSSCKLSARTAFDLIIIDESSQLAISTASIAINRLSTSSRLIIAGDHQQLGPIRTRPSPSFSFLPFPSFLSH